MEEIKIVVADESHEKYVDSILQTISDAASVRGTGIARRTHEYLLDKILQAKAVIALAGDRFAGFSYIETWENKKYVTTSGLIVHPDFRGQGIAKRIKDLTFSLARTRWPNAKIFSLTSGAAVMTMNTQLGYKPVTFAELTDDDAFWDGCNGCKNVDILRRTDRHYCICTAMLFDPEEHLPAKIPEDVLRRIERLEAHPQPLPGEGGSIRTAHPQPLPGEGGSIRKSYQTADCANYDVLKELADKNRKNPTEAEAIIWNYLKGKQLGLHFRRQHIIGNYIVDFSCPTKKIAIEIDGGYHDQPEQKEYDEKRSEWLISKGWKIIRFKNEEIIANTENVISKIKKEI
ncbi:MAG: DUF559 domain-containing protein [Prevotella sp.]|nr:DUF559 domain-containing protein [Prevotella sp.]